MAHNSLPNCLTEVCNGIIAYIKNKNLSVKDLMEYIPGPDFPLPNTVINKKDIYTAFNTGHSAVSLKVRGEYEIDGNKIIFTSIPYRTYRNKIKEQINNNIEEFEKVLEDFYDESSVGQNRLVFYAKEGKVNKALNKLFSLTDLQTSLSYNLNFIVNGTPRLCSLRDLIQSYYEHQINVLNEATKYDKRKAEERAHILRGLIMAIDQIDTVIALIKGSSDKNDATKKLINLLSIDEIQASAILDMKLAKLTRIDKNELIEELAQKEAIVAECNKILDNSEYRDDVLIKKISEMKEKYGDARRTKLIDLKIDDSEKEEEPEIEPEKCVVIMTENGNIKRIPHSSFRTQNRNTKGVHTNGDIIKDIIRTSTVDAIMAFTNLGRVHKLPVINIPAGTNSTKGANISSLLSLEFGEKVSTIYSIYKDNPLKYVFFATKNGLAKKTSLDNFTKISRATKAINVREGDSIASVSLINEEQVLLLTKKGMIIRFKTSDINPIGKDGMGVKGINLSEGDEVICALPIRDEKDDLIVFASDGNGKRVALKEFLPQRRGGKGISAHKKEIADACLGNDEDAVLIAGDQTSVCISVKDISVQSRTNTGVKLIKGNIIKKVSKI